MIYERSIPLLCTLVFQMLLKMREFQFEGEFDLGQGYLRQDRPVEEIVLDKQYVRELWEKACCMLTDKEWEVFVKKSMGISGRQIAREEGVKHQTIEQRFKVIRQKLHDLGFEDI